MKRRYYFVFLLILVSQIFMLSGCATNEEIPIPKSQADIYVYDDDDLFNDSVESQLNNMLVDLEKKTDVEFAVVTVKSLLDREIEDYSITVANGLGIGKEEEDNGILLLMSRSDERVRLEIGKGLEGILNDSKCGRILDEFFVPNREDDKYVEATVETVQAVINVIALDNNVKIEGVDGNITVSDPTPIPWGLIIFIIIVVLLALAVINHYTDGAVVDFFAFISSSDSGGSSGGGFGGGSFGGGGASR